MPTLWVLRQPNQARRCEHSSHRLCPQRRPQPLPKITSLEIGGATTWAVSCCTLHCGHLTYITILPGRSGTGTPLGNVHPAMYSFVRPPFGVYRGATTKATNL